MSDESIKKDTSEKERSARIAYLAHDAVGASSRIVYGKAGDQVEILSYDHGIVMVQRGKEKFFVVATELLERHPGEIQKLDDKVTKAPEFRLSAPMPQHKSKKRRR